MMNNKTKSSIDADHTTSVTDVKKGRNGMQSAVELFFMIKDYLVEY